MTYLIPEQVHELNERHGWFEFGDAQSDVSKAFAQDAIAMHEAMRGAAPEMLAALKVLVQAVDCLDPQFGYPIGWDALMQAMIVAEKAIDRATTATKENTHE